MRHRPRAVVPALALVSVLTPAAYASDHIEWAGFTCRFVSTNDPTGLVEQDPNTQTGELNCGPWTAADILNDDGTPSTSPSPAEITIIGTIQVNEPNHGPGITTTPRATCVVVGTAVAYGSCTVRYPALPTDNVYLCTYIKMTTADGEIIIWDDDGNPANGLQCSLATSAEP